MLSLEPYTKSILEFMASKKGLIGIGVVLFAVLLLLLNRCSNIAHEESYFIGQDIQWKGVNLLGKEKNFSAFNHDLLSAIANEESIRFRLIGTAAYELEPMLIEEELQGILTTQQPTPIKLEKYVFSDPYFVTGSVLTVSNSSHIEGWNEMAKKIVGAPSYSAAVLELQKDHSIQVKIYDDINRAFIDLDAQKIDGVIYPALPSYVYVKTFYPGRLKIVTAPLNHDGVRLMALNNEAGNRLVREFNEGLTKTKADGIYDTLIERWGLIDAGKLGAKKE